MSKANIIGLFEAILVQDAMTSGRAITIKKKNGGQAICFLSATEWGSMAQLSEAEPIAHRVDRKACQWGVPELIKNGGPEILRYTSKLTS
jgi:hypothetical protein